MYILTSQWVQWNLRTTLIITFIKILIIIYYLVLIKILIFFKVIGDTMTYITIINTST